MGRINAITGLRPADAEEPGLVVGPVRIAEASGAGAEGIGAEGQPGGGGRHRGGFDDDGSIAGPGDQEAELVGLDAKAGAGGEDDWIRQHPKGGQQTAKGRPPSTVARQVVGRRLAVTAESVRTEAGCISLEIEARQAGAVIERIVSDAGNAVAQQHVRQAGASIKRGDSYDVDIVADSDIAQAGDKIERIVPDVFHREANNLAGKGDGTTGAGVSRDGDCRGTIGIKKIAGLSGPDRDRGGQEQCQEGEHKGSGAEAEGSSHCFHIAA